MAPLTKEPEVLTPAADATASRPGGQTAKPAAPAAPGVRADAVSVEVQVRVYGSRITQVPGQAEPNSEPFEEQTSTMIVFPQGAVLRMSTNVGVGQMLVVTNAKTKADAICRVVKVRTFSNTQGYVEVEFTTSQKNYWGVRFPSEGPAPAAPAPSAPAASAPAVVAPPPAPAAQKPVDSVKAPAPAPVAATPSVQAPASAAPVAPVVTPAPVATTPAFAPPPAPKPVAAAPPPAIPAAPKVDAPARVASAPVAPAASVVEDEDLETILSRLTPAMPTPAAASPVAAPPSLDAVFSAKPVETVEPKASAPVAVEPAKPAPAIEFPAVPPPAPVPSLTLSDLRGDAIAEPANNSEDTEVIEQESLLKHGAVEPVVEAPRRSVGSFSGGLSLTGGASIAASSAAETTVEESASSNTESSSVIGGGYAEPTKKSNFLLIAACIGALVVVAGGGAFYFHTSAAGSKAAAPNATVQAPKSAEAEAPGETPEQSALRNTVTESNASGQPAVAIPVATPQPARVAATQPTGNDPGVTVTPTISHARQQKAIENVVDATANAHPVAAQRTDAGGPGAAPAVDGDGSGSGNTLSGLVAGNDGSSLKAPEIRQEGPLRIGGNVKEPQLLSHVMPQYPLTAKEAGIQGDVVIQTTVDEHGNVVNMKVVSGPMMLRQPALEALKRWKYAPSTLNGQPISVQMSVTIKFNNR
ncbi:MAG: TonB family protein [Candidatus Acidiferrales bacterium]